MTLLVGADVGGTSTRVAVADRDGTVFAVAREDAGNPNAVGVEISAARIRSAMEAALRQARGAEVGAVVLGLAGYGTALAAGADFLRACTPPEVSVRPRIVSDLGVAFASATPLPRGSVVIAGTGSSAARIDRGEIVDRRGGWGWLLGDEGGGFWLGREAVRHALAEVEQGSSRSPLTRRVLDELRHRRAGGEAADADPGADPGRADLDLLLRAPYDKPPVRLADLAPAVTELVDTDPAAVAIAARAADQLARLVVGLRPLPGLPIVTAGSVLQTAGPIRHAFATRLEQQIGSAVLGATSGLVGALWLAHGTDRDGRILPVHGDPSRVGQLDPTVHRRLLTTLPDAPPD